VSLLIEKGADLSLTTEDGSQPIHYVVRNKTDAAHCIEVINQMIEKVYRLVAERVFTNSEIHFLFRE